MIDKIKKIKYNRLNILERYFIENISGFNIIDSYYVKNSTILFEHKGNNLYLNRIIYNNMFILFSNSNDIVVKKHTFESFIIFLFKKYLEIDINPFSIDPSTQDYWELKNFK